MSAIGFGLLLPHGPASAEARATYLEDCERNLETIKGHFTSVWMSDHLQVDSHDVLECWTTLTYLAGRFPDLSFGSGVMCQAFRNPALVAKMAATFQFLTGGRLILGMGTGWKEDEFLSYNYPFLSPNARVSELEEAIRIIKLMWVEEKATFEGAHYQIHSARCEPRPQPPPHIVVGAHHPRMLRIAARLADWWDVSGSAIGRNDYPALSAEMDRALAEVGRDPRTLRRSYSGPCLVTTSQNEIDQYAGNMPIGRGITGTPEQVADQLRRLVALGVTHFQLVFAGFPNPRPLDLFIKEVLPHVERL
ncbi:MAG: LLM class flavin-dependent oxidoreductase [Chloroflexia bacterium]